MMNPDKFYVLREDFTLVEMRTEEGRSPYVGYVSTQFVSLAKGFDTLLEAERCMSEERVRWPQYHFGVVWVS